MVAINPTISIIPLNMNYINSPIKGQILVEWIKKKTKANKQKVDPTVSKRKLQLLFYFLTKLSSE